MQCNSSSSGSRAWKESKRARASGRARQRERECVCCEQRQSASQMLLVKQQKCCQQPKRWQHLLLATTTTTATMKRYRIAFWVSSNLIKTVAKTQTEPLRAPWWHWGRMGNVAAIDFSLPDALLKLIYATLARALFLSLFYLLLSLTLWVCALSPWMARGTPTHYVNARKWASHVICCP